MKEFNKMKSKKDAMAIVTFFGLALSQAVLASAKPMDPKAQQICAAIGLIYHYQAKGYDVQIKKGQELISQTTEPKMKKTIQDTVRDMTAVRDNINKLGDFMERELGKAESSEKINFATTGL